MRTCTPVLIFSAWWRDLPCFKDFVVVVVVVVIGVGFLIGRYLEADEFALMIRTMRKNAGVDSARAVSHDEQSAPVVAGGNLQADPTELFTDPFHEALAIALHDFKIRFVRRA